LENLLDQAYLARRAALVDRRRAQDFGAGAPKEGGTVYLAAGDSDRMMVSLIQSSYSGFGSGVVVPGTGISLQNRGSYPHRNSFLLFLLSARSVADSSDIGLEVVRMVMPIDLLQHFDAHTQIARRLPTISAGLHQPGSGSMAQRMGSHLPGKTGEGKPHAESPSLPIQQLHH
jgi:hypothetical protein